MTPVLELDDVWIDAGSAEAPLTLVRGASFSIEKGQIVGLVGESGSGKTVTCMSVLGLGSRGVRISRGSVRVAGTELVGADAATLQRMRGGVVGTVFQDPLRSLNPLQRIGAQVTEAIALHQGGRRRDHRERAIHLLTEVGIPAPEQRLRMYPHELSGGLRQRVAIAMALANDPDLLIADEPTTALDVTVQAQVLEVIREATRGHGRAALLVTHDLGLVAEVADRILVMYAGQIVEQGTVDEVFARPQHHYTKGLLASRPRLEPGRRELDSLAGRPPLPGNWPAGCAFAPRCAAADSACAAPPPIVDTPSGWARCWHPASPPAMAPTSTSEV